MSAPQTAASSRRQSASSSAVSSPMARSDGGEELDGFAAALALQEAAARPGLPKQEVARLLEKVGVLEGDRRKKRMHCTEGIEIKTQPLKLQTTTTTTKTGLCSLRRGRAPRARPAGGPLQPRRGPH